MTTESPLIRRSGMLLCLVGPAASGKTSLSRHLIQDHGKSVQLSISVTSRAPRENEQEGTSYFFVTKEEFENRIARNEFFEWENNHGNLYGTPNKTVLDAIQGGVDLLLDIDIRGALNFKRGYPQNTLIVFLVPPSFAVLKDRLLSRGRISDSERKTRFETARSEYQKLLSVAGDRNGVDYLLVNDDFDHTYQMLNSILNVERLRIQRLKVDDLQKICRIEEEV